MKKLSYLIKYGLKKRIMSKAFVISNVVVGLLIIAVTMLPSLVTMFTGGKGEVLNDTILIVNTTGYEVGEADLGTRVKDTVYYSLLNPQFGYEVELTINVTTNANRIPTDNYYDETNIEKGLVYIYLELIDPDGNPLDKDNEKIVVKIYDSGMHPAVLQMIQVAVSDLQRFKYQIDHPTFDPTLVSDLQPVMVENPNVVDDGVSEIMAAFAPVVIIPIFILITFAFQAIGAEIIEEKSTKAIEIIIASVKPSTHFLAKNLSLISFQLIQLFLYFMYGVVGIVGNELISKAGGLGSSWGNVTQSLDIDLLPVIGFVLICALIGTTLYSVVGAFIGSLSINQEDYQQTQSPVMLLLTFGYMGAIFAGTLGSKEAILILSYIPFFTPMVLPVNLAMGFMTIGEAWIGVAIVLAFVVLLVILISPLYRASILSYDQSGLFKRIKNTIKTAKALKENQKMYEENHLE
ncbi:ABC transporter permease [Acholeplasma equirhinis]|uniref:ABC transporter permease n=1 Tax=Acholeplasma equirhinis TaxID=555393 RepID=UPI00197AE788|nr:ABC transporter permease [Acholeplasma equirhinis]MBN3490660.1 ABC transporter permease [Acholeplasma equirhinis]